jgi:hypothetical protein
MLFACLPHLAAVGLFWIGCNDLFRAESAAPANWQARLILPIATGCLTAIAAAEAEDAQRAWTLSVLAAALVFILLILAVFRKPESFLDLQLPIGIRDTRVAGMNWWMVIRGLGLAVLAYACIVNVFVVGDEPGGTSHSPVSSPAHSGATQP